MEELLELNRGLLKAKKEQEVEAKALGKELKQVKGEQERTQKELVEAKPKVAQMQELKKKLGQANEKTVGPEDKIEQLKGKVEKAKEVKVDEYKESVDYRMSNGYAATEFLSKEKIKMRRLIILKTCHAQRTLIQSPSFPVLIKMKKMEKRQNRRWIKTHPRKSSLEQSPPT